MVPRQAPLHWAFALPRYWTRTDCTMYHRPCSRMSGKGRQRRSTTVVGDFALRLHLAASGHFASSMVRRACPTFSLHRTCQSCRI